MYINRMLLLVIAIVLIFFPAIDGWLSNSETALYRPYLPWLLVIVAAYWNQRARRSDDL